MTSDSRLEQLKVVQERAFTKKQEAYQKQQDSWKKLSEAKSKLNQAFEAKQDAYNSQERAWQDYRSISDHNGPRIEYLKSAQEAAYLNMKDAFDRASSAHDCHDGASAKSYATEGHKYQAESKSYVEERRRLVAECRSAKAQYEPYKQAFEDAKIVFGNAKDEYEQAKVTRERANNEFKQAKADFDEAAKAFQARLSELKTEYTKKKESNQAIAARAGVPYQYRNDVYVSEDSDGTKNIYFGGMGKPDGPGHGHYSIDSYGSIIYKREPFDPHGHQNFEDDGACKKSGWGKRTVGTIEGFEVTFRQGFGDKEGQTLIADGTPSGREFDRRKGHNHYGDKEEGGGRIEDDRGDRGKYTGPGH